MMMQFGCGWFEKNLRDLVEMQKIVLKSFSLCFLLFSSIYNNNLLIYIYISIFIERKKNFK